MSQIVGWHGLSRLSQTLAIPLLLTATVAGQHRYHERIPLLSIGTLGDTPDGRRIFPDRMTPGDLNGDGLEDVFVEFAIDSTSPGPETPFKILLNDGAGGLIDGTANILVPPNSTAFGAHTTFVADFNGDGRMDVFVGVPGLDVASMGGAQDRLWLSQPDGRLHDVTAEKLPQLPSSPQGSSYADVDGDGDLDIFVKSSPGFVSPPAYLMLNDGTGGFTIVADLGNDFQCMPPVAGCPIVGRNGRFPEDLYGAGSWSAFLDAEGDGDQDLYLGLADWVLPVPGCDAFGCREQGLVFLLNDSTGRFEFAPPDALPTLLTRARGDFNQEVNHHQVQDVDEDGLTDLILSDQGETRYIQILISNGNGTYRDETYLRLPRQWEDPRNGPYLYFRDLDGDGHDDLVGGQSDPVGVEFYLNDGKGFFRRLPVDWLPALAEQYVPIDLDGDGGVDFLDDLGWEQADLELTRSIVPYGPDLAGDGSDDLLLGGAFDNVLEGLDGDDTLDGGTGNDTLKGGPDNDLLIGGDGNDTLEGDHGDDTLFGSPGDDALSGGPGMDLLLGGAGDDLLFGGEAESAPQVVEDDSREAPATSLITEDTLVGGTGTDTITGSDRNDVILLRRGDVDAGETEQIDGRDGHDTVVVNGFDLGDIDLAGANLSDPATAGTYALSSIEQIQHSGFFAQIGNGAGLTSVFVLTNPFAGDNVDVSLFFSGDDGNDLNLGLAGEGAVSRRGFNFPPLGSFELATDGQGDLTPGAARLLAAVPVGGVVQFSIPGLGTASVGNSQLLDSFLTPVVRDSETGVSTGIAIYNNGPAATVRMKLNRLDGTFRRSALVELPANGHVSKFVEELFPTLGDFEGTLTVMGDLVAATALQLGDDPGEFTTLPVVPVSPRAASGTVYFSHFGNGSGLLSSVFLLNPSEEERAKGNLSFLGDSGAVLSVGVNGEDPATEFPFDIAPQGGAVFTTDGLGEVVGGSAQVAVDEGVVGGVLRFTLPGFGIAGVGSSEAVRSFIIPVQRQKETGVNTGVSISSTGQAVSCTLVLRQNGQPIAGGQANLNLAANGHKADFLEVLFPTVDTSNFRGTLTLTVDNPGATITATALELGGLGHFTTLPVTALE